MILTRLNGSVTPLRFTTARTASSTVVKRLPHSGHERRRRISAPSSASRESTTRESAWRQYGQRTSISLRSMLPRVSRHAETRRRDGQLHRAAVHGLWITGEVKPQPVDDLHPCNY